MNIKIQRANEDEGDIRDPDKKVSYYVEQVPGPKIVRVNITTDFETPDFYDELFHLLTNLDKGDVVVYTINSNGGYLSGLTMLLEANAVTEAHTVAHIVGSCHSCASMLAMSCDEVIVGNYSEMLVHSVRFGYGGKVADNKAHVAHTDKYTEQIFRELYVGFLSEEEILEVLSGKEQYMLPEEIRDRLEARAAYMQALYESLDD